MTTETPVRTPSQACSSPLFRTLRHSRVAKSRPEHADEALLDIEPFLFGPGVRPPRRRARDVLRLQGRDFSGYSFAMGTSAPPIGSLHRPEIRDGARRTVSALRSSSSRWPSRPREGIKPITSRYRRSSWHGRRYGTSSTSSAHRALRQRRRRCRAHRDQCSPSAAATSAARRSSPRTR